MKSHLSVVSSMSWVSCLIFWSFLFSTIEYQLTNGNDGIPQRQATTNMKLRYSCACNDSKGNIYDLRTLAKHGGKPRFSVQADDYRYWFSYNPCVSFSLGSLGDCSGGDVAICKWPWTNTSYENIGTQRSFKCRLGKDGKPEFEYSNRGKERGWSSVIRLQCDWDRKSVKSANFTIQRDKYSPRLFTLTHLCACPNGCPEPTSTTQPSTTRYVTPTSQNPYDGKDIWLPVAIAAGSVIFVFIFFVVVFRLIQRPVPPPERRRLLRQDDPIIDESKNSFPRVSSQLSSKGRRSPDGSDEGYMTPPVSMTSARSCSDIVVPDKNEVYKSKGTSKLDQAV